MIIWVASDNLPAEAKVLEELLLIAFMLITLLISTCKPYIPILWLEL